MSVLDDEESKIQQYHRPQLRFEVGQTVLCKEMPDDPWRSGVIEKQWGWVKGEVCRFPYVVRSDCGKGLVGIDDEDTFIKEHQRPKPRIDIGAQVVVGESGLSPKWLEGEVVEHWFSHDGAIVPYCVREYGTGRNLPVLTDTDDAIMKKRKREGKNDRKSKKNKVND